MTIDVIANRLFEFGNTAKDTVSQAIVCQVSEPAFYHVQPRTAGRRDVEMKAWMPLEPSLYLGMLVCGVVVGRSRSAGVSASIFLRNLIHS